MSRNARAAMTSASPSFRGDVDDDGCASTTDRRGGCEVTAIRGTSSEVRDAHSPPSRMDSDGRRLSAPRSSNLPDDQDGRTRPFVQRPTGRRVALALASAALLAGCGGDDEAPGAEVRPTSVAAYTAEVAPLVERVGPAAQVVTRGDLSELPERAEVAEGQLADIREDLAAIVPPADALRAHGELLAALAEAEQGLQAVREPGGTDQGLAQLSVALGLIADRAEALDAQG